MDFLLIYKLILCNLYLSFMPFELLKFVQQQFYALILFFFFSVKCHVQSTLPSTWLILFSMISKHNYHLIFFFLYYEKKEKVNNRLSFSFAEEKIKSHRTYSKFKILVHKYNPNSKNKEIFNIKILFCKCNST